MNVFPNSGETTLERDVRLRIERGVDDAVDRIGDAEKWQAAHEALCAERYKQILSWQRLILLALAVVVAMTIPGALPHILAGLTWLR